MCTVPAGVLVCMAGVCDTSDSACGYKNGDGPCNAASGGTVCRSGVCGNDSKCGIPNGEGPCTLTNGPNVCRSGVCSANGLCEPAGSCNVDADCSGGNWCSESSHTCTRKLANGVAIPVDAAHSNPTLNGTCTAQAGALVCQSGLCDTADNKCGLANGDGACTVITGPTVCRSGVCGANGLCENPDALQFVPVTPCRVFDSRNANGPLGGPTLVGGVSRTIPVTSSACGIPSSAKAYSVNATVVPRAGTLGYFTLWPTGQSQPNVSTLNAPDGSVLANAAIVPAGTGGSIDVFALQNTDFILDINGYFTAPGPSTLAFYPVTPCRAVDTRNSAGVFGGPFITGGTSRDFPLQSSSCGVPASARAYSMNVTVVPKGFLGYITAWPTGQPQPGSSVLNSLDGTVLANAAIVPVGTPNGSTSFFASNDTDLIVDINGYFAPTGTGGLNYYTVNPCRAVDTRNAAGPLGGPIMNGNSSRTFPLASSACGLPATAGAYSLNMTVAPSGFLGYLSVLPTGQSQPNVSTLNDPKGIVTANAALVPAGTIGSVDVFVLNTTHVIIDVNGYFGQ